MKMIELKQRWQTTHLSENALAIAKCVLVDGQKKAEVARDYGVSREYVGKVCKRIIQI